MNLNHQINSKLLPKRMLTTNANKTQQLTSAQTASSLNNTQNNEAAIRRNVSGMGIHQNYNELSGAALDFRCEYEVPKFCDLNDPDEFPVYRMDNRGSTIATQR